MNLTAIILLAVLQGVAEFLPVSSSGHLVISQHFLGVQVEGVRLDICLHVGTLISIFAFYRKTLVRLIMDCFSLGAEKAARVKAWMFVFKLLVSSTPAIFVYFLFDDRIKAIFENAEMVGIFLMLTGAVLIGTRFLPCGRKNVSFVRAVLMGLGQAIALLPGVSRSGMTLVSGRAAGVDPEKAAEFSFLMSTPLIIGALILEIVKSFTEIPSESVAQESWAMMIFGMAIAAIVGYYSLKILVKTLKSRWFWIFGFYCFAAGLATVLLV